MKELERIFETKEGFTTFEGNKIEAALLKDIETKFRIDEYKFSQILEKNKPANSNAYIMDFLDLIPKKEIPIHIRIRYYKT